MANVVEYEPTEPNPYAIHRIITRIKAEEEIWNKVVDEIFELDRIVSRDKQLRHLSRYVKDIFGIKIVLGELSSVYDVQRALEEQAWTIEQLAAMGIEPVAATNSLEFIDVKDYLLKEERKKSGWAAMKSAVRWSDKTFEVQAQPLRDFLREREALALESHTSFKARRERIRDRVGRRIPLFRFYQELLRWLFLNVDYPPPAYNRVTVRLVA